MTTKVFIEQASKQVFTYNLEIYYTGTRTQTLWCIEARPHKHKIKWNKNKKEFYGQWNWITPQSVYKILQSGKISMPFSGNIFTENWKLLFIGITGHPDLWPRTVCCSCWTFKGRCQAKVERWPSRRCLICLQQWCTPPMTWNRHTACKQSWCVLCTPMSSMRSKICRISDQASSCMSHSDLDSVLALSARFVCW